MVKVQIELDENQDEFVSIFKINNKLKTKADAIIKIIDEYEKQKRKRKS